jgi:hypothetical protein
MQTKWNDVWAVSNNSTPIPELADSASNIVVLNEASLKDANGGAFWVPIAVAVGRCAASTACRVGVLAAAGAAAAWVGYENNRV